MTPAVGGRHCASCEKVVTDFTRMTDGELVAWFARHQGERVCGQVDTVQLNRVLQPAAAPASWWGRAVWAIVAALGLRPAGSVQAQVPAVPQLIVPVTPVTKQVVHAPTTAEQDGVAGTVVEGTTMKPIAFVDIVLRAGHRVVAHAQSDLSGRFRLPLPASSAYAPFPWKLQVAGNGFAYWSAKINSPGDLRRLVSTSIAAELVAPPISTERAIGAIACQLAAPVPDPHAWKPVWWQLEDGLHRTVREEDLR